MSRFFAIENPILESGDGLVDPLDVVHKGYSFEVVVAHRADLFGHLPPISLPNEEALDA